MTVKTLAVVLATLGSLASAAADTWYVDAAAAAGGDGSIAKPFAVIQDAVDKAAGGDTIYVAAGEYKTGGKDTYGWSRVEIVGKPGLKLIGAGRGKSFIVGSRDPAAGDAYSEDDGTLCRCVCVATSSGAVVQGFTLRDGETGTSGTSASAKNTGGGFKADADDAYLVDCEVSHCAGKYGSPIYQGTAVRCLFDRNFGTGGPGGRGARLVNTVVTRSKPSGSSTATLHECRLYNCTVIDNATTWAVQTENDEIYNSLLLLSGNADIYRETNKVCRVENSVLSHTAPKSLWQVMGPLTGDWRLLNDSDAIGAGSADWLTGLSLPDGIDAFRDFNGKTIVPDAQGRIHAGALQTVVTPAGGALVFKAPNTVSVDGYVMRRASSSYVGYVYPETYPTQFCVKANLAGDQVLYKIVRYNGKGKAYGQGDMPGFVPREEGGAMYLLPPPSKAMASTNQVIAATQVFWCDDDAYGNGYVGEDLGSAEHPFGTIQAALDAVTQETPTVIFIKPGVYSKDMKQTEAYGNFRVFCDVEKNYVRIASTEGPDKTFIVGAPDLSTLTSDTFPGCGETAVKGVGLRGANYVLQGLTICGCYSSTVGSYAKPGVAFQAKNSVPALVVDCVMSNNVSSSSICADGIYRRCVFRGNTSHVQTVSGQMVASCFLADNVLTLSSSGATGPVTGSGGIYNLTLVCPEKSGRLYSDATHYNCIFDGGQNLYSACRATNSIAYNYSKCYSPDDFIVADPRFVDRGVSPVVKADSPAIGAGFALTADNYGIDYWKAMDGDLFGDPLVFSASGAPTIGAVQNPVDLRALTFAKPEKGGLATSDGRTGTFELVDGSDDSVSFVPAAGTRPCAGLRIGETEFWFTNTPDNVISFDYAALKAFESPIAVEPLYTTDWYVDDDGDDTRSGMLPSLARKTLTAAMAACASGDTLWALPGTYAEGAAKANVSKHSVSNRVVVKAGVTLRSTQGKEQTFICGAPAPEETRDEYGCGSNAVRCVYLAGADARVWGFTLKDGRADLETGSDTDGYAGGVLGNASSDGREPDKGYWVVDCLITNCVAKQGAAMTRACLIRSRAVGNTAMHSVVYQGSAYGSYVDHNEVASTVFSYSKNIVGTTVGPDNLTSAGEVANVSANTIGTGGVFLNSLFCQPLTPGGSSTTTIRNCVCAKGSKLETNNHADTNGTVVVAADADGVAIDENGVPVIGKCLAVDAGDIAWFADETYPTLDDKTDLAGNQRIYNGTVDAGCFEADWRPVYAKCIGRSKYVSVTAADPSVTTNEIGRVTIPSGSLAATLTNDGGVDATYVLKVAATGGALTVSVDGVPVGEPIVSRTREIELKNLDALARLDFTFDPAAENSGAATILSLRKQVGLMLIVR